MAYALNGIPAFVAITNMSALLRNHLRSDQLATYQGKALLPSRNQAVFHEAGYRRPHRHKLRVFLQKTDSCDHVSILFVVFIMLDRRAPTFARLSSFTPTCNVAEKALCRNLLRELPALVRGLTTTPSRTAQLRNQVACKIRTDKPRFRCRAAASVSV